MSLVAFGSILILGAVVISISSHDFGPSETTTTATVTKGQGASRHVTVTTPSGRITRTEGVGPSDKKGPPTASPRPEQPNNPLARQKTTTETHHKSFLEGLIGDQGLLFLQFGAVFIAAFIGAAIVYRLCAGNYQFKVGMFDFSFEETTKETTAFVAALRDSVEAMRLKLGELETERLGITEPAAAALRVPRADPYIARVASVASTGRPGTEATVLRAAITSLREELAREPAPQPIPEPQSSTTPKPGRQSEPAAKSGSRSKSASEPKPKTPPSPTGTSADGELPADARLDEMEALLRFAPEETSRRENKRFALAYWTLARSAQTYQAICSLLRVGSPVQAGMMIKPLSEDVVLADLLIGNEDRREEVERILREGDHPGAWRSLLDYGPPYGTTGDPKGDRKAGSKIDPPGLGGLFPEFTTGISERFMLALQKAISEWLADLARPSLVSLQFFPEDELRIEPQVDPTNLIEFTAAWLFALQVSQRARIDRASAAEMEEISEIWAALLKELGTPVVGRENAIRLLDEWRDQFPPDAPIKATSS